MVQCQLKLRMCKAQERICEQWLYHLTAVYNFAVRKIELNANNKIYFTEYQFKSLLVGHGQKLGVPSHVLQGILGVVFTAWTRCFRKIARKPRLKGACNKLASIPFPDPFRPPKGNRIHVVGLGSVRFHRMELPNGKIKCGRIIKRASGWYLCLIIDADPKPIARLGNGAIGIDPGFSNLLTISSGETIRHPRELESSSRRLAQAQRARNRHLAGRIRERIRNKRKDRNHKLSRRLVSENIKIVFSKDKIRGIAKVFGKSVESSGHGQLRMMLAYKSPKSGTEYIEVDSRFSTMTCSACGSRTGPVGLCRLAVRQWACSECGTTHDRDINAAINTLIAGAGCAHEKAYAHA